MYIDRKLDRKETKELSEISSLLGDIVPQNTTG